MRSIGSLQLRALLFGGQPSAAFKSGNHVTDNSVAVIHQFPVFKTWQGGAPQVALMAFNPDPNFLLLRGSITDAGVASLVGLDGLFALNLERPEAGHNCYRPQAARRASQSWLSWI